MCNNNSSNIYNNIYKLAMHQFSSMHKHLSKGFKEPYYLLVFLVFNMIQKMHSICEKLGYVLYIQLSVNIVRHI